MSNRPIILIGAGGIVESAHLPAYQKAGLKVIGITDLDQQKARNIAKKFNVPNVYDSVHQATIHAPEHTIFDIAIPASGLVDLLPTFRNGSTLLIQKPMGENIKQAQQIKQICRQVSLEQCETIAHRAMEMDSAREIDAYLQEQLRKVAPELVF